tara:strand:+ start:273 stop:587 length:315 start_codon:yes stop_codon:yes gene_type:complete
MGKNSKESSSHAGQGSKPERSRQCTDRDNPKQRPLAKSNAIRKAKTSVGCFNDETINARNEGWESGYKMGLALAADLGNMISFYETKISSLEKELKHFKELAKR